MLTVARPRAPVRASIWTISGHGTILSNCQGALAPPAAIIRYRSGVRANGPGSLWTYTHFVEDSSQRTRCAVCAVFLMEVESDVASTSPDAGDDGTVGEDAAKRHQCDRRCVMWQRQWQRRPEQQDVRACGPHEARGSRSIAFSQFRPGAASELGVELEPTSPQRPQTPELATPPERLAVPLPHPAP